MNQGLHRKLAGLDTSMTGTGVVHNDGLSTVPCVHTIKTKTVDGDRRLVQIKNQAEIYVATAEFVLMEGYLNKSMSAGITGMVHGAVRTMLIELEIPYATIPPTSLKLYATGSGSAEKRDMAVAAYKRAAVEFGNDNECDAWWAWVMLHDFLGSPLFELPQANRRSLTKIKKEYG